MQEKKKGDHLMDNNATRKFCNNCGAPLQPGVKFCTYCGTPVPQQAAPVRNTPPQQSAPNPYNYGTQPAANQGNQNSYSYAAQNAAPVHAAEPMTKAQYRKVCTEPKYRKSLKTNAIVMYVLAGLNLLLSIATNPFGLLEVAITLGLTLGMHLGKSKGCAIGLLVYGIVNIVILLVLNGSISGWLWLVLAISSLRAFSIADKEYESIYGK